MVFLILLIYLIGLALIILEVVALWRVFVKMREPGWKSLIPLYNLYILSKNCWRVNYFWLFIALTILYTILALYAQYSIVINPSALDAGVAALVSYALLIGLYCIYGRGCHWLAESFDCTVGMAVGLFFLTPIFLAILAFNDYEYIGNVNGYW